MMNIEVITVWYNEEFLAPFFLNHYSFASTIHILLDADTNDNTLQIIKNEPNVKTYFIKFPDKFDDKIKIDEIMKVYRKIKNGWVIAVDSDEFVFPLPQGIPVDQALDLESRSDVIFAQMWQVYRHRLDKDLDPSLKPVPQRRHGDPNVSSGINALYNKPIIVKAGLNFEWGVGCHHIHFLRSKNKFIRILTKIIGTPKISPNKFRGVHWAMADPLFAIERRKSRKARLSQNNIDMGYGCHYLNEEEIGLKLELESHLDDPLLF